MSFLQPLVLIFIFGVVISIFVYIGILQAFVEQRSRMFERSRSNSESNS